MYSKKPGLIIGFHGCDESVRDDVILKEGVLLHSSNNNYDWLGSGVYFWENNYSRALHWAEFLRDNPPKDPKKTPIKKPSVIGAVIDLGYCMDLLDSHYLKILKESHDTYMTINKKYGYQIPRNTPLQKNGDLLLRRLDCAVIEAVHEFNRESKKEEYDSVRGVFFEGNELYDNAGFREKNHIQIAVRNPNCIKGYFIPRAFDKNHSKP